jgi:prepilin-type N-terminal cleavage/methylation domain-containing protein
MTGLITRVRRSRRDEVGLTLVEMLVAMMIMSVIFAAVGSIFVVTMKAMSENRNQLDQANSARVGIESVARALREAVLPSQDVGSGSCTTNCLPALISGTATSLQFFSNIDNPVNNATSGTNNFGPRLVSYSVNAANSLVQTIEVPDTHQWDDYNWVYSGCTVVPANCQTHVIATDVTQVSGAAIFTYYQDEGATKLTGTSFDSAALKQVDSIDVVLSTKVAHGSGAHIPTTYLQRVTLPNVDTFISEGGT